MRTTSKTNWNDSCNTSRSEEFPEQSFPEALSEFQSLKTPFNYPVNTVLFMEEQAPSKSVTT